MAGSFASLGGLNGAEGGLCTDEGGIAIPADDGDVGNVVGEAARLVPVPAGVPRLSAPRWNFCRGIWGGAGGLTFFVFSATVEVGVGCAGFRFVLI